MKKLEKILVIGVTSVLFFSGMLGVTANGNGGDGGDPGGLTPGFWKNHLSMWVYFEDDDPIDGPFDVPSELSGDTLLEALRYKGGRGVLGAARILLRAAVAGILNYEYLGYDGGVFEYPMTLYEIIDEVNAALASGDRGIMLDLKDTLDDYNNLGI